MIHIEKERIESRGRKKSEISIFGCARVGKGDRLWPLWVGGMG